MEQSEELIEILERLNSGEPVNSVRADAQDFLSRVSPADLSIAEQKLVEAGLEPTDLRHLCSLHLEMMKDELTKMQSQLAPGHVIDTFVKEHDSILKYLDMLNELNNEIQQQTSFDINSSEIKEFKKISNILLESEIHYQREEQALFPEVEKNGVYGPTSVMLMEHEDLRKYKKNLAETIENFSENNFLEEKKKLNAILKLLDATLRDHIFKENNILYPTSLDVILGENYWNIIKNKCDEIGYCSFSPDSK